MRWCAMSTAPSPRARRQRCPYPCAIRARVLAAEALQAAGRDPGGRAVQLAARLFIVDDQFFQIVALGAEGEISSDALDTFFASFRLI